ncbi:MAG: GNAT family N-acetyltransferase [Clostridia bacterium]|nr:GNAT family N-acetyltransferase [Clostridia bacterium]
MYVKVTDAPYFAKGDGITNDREAIQKAIDDVYAAGGGTVELDAYKTFLSSGIIIRSGVELHFGERAILHQTDKRDEYVKPSGNGYEPYLPMLGHNWSETIKWSHCWYKNYPLIFAPEGSKNFKITGKGTIRMMEVTDPEKIIKICPIGFYRCSDFEISDIHITNYHSYALMPFTSTGGLFKNLIIDNWSYGNGDGICLMNCRDIRITGCNMFTGDDSIYIFSSYCDPRRSEWWNSDEPQASMNIEIDHNDLRSNHCKAFGMILWGIGCPDLEKVEVRNVYVHDNHIETLGNWLYNPYSTKKGNPPVTSVRFENNVIDGIEINFFETVISDMTHFRSMAEFENTEFVNGLCFWAMNKNKSDDCLGSFRRPDTEGGSYAYMKDFDKGDVRLYQGVYITTQYSHTFRAKLHAPGSGIRMFVRKTDTDEMIASKVVKSDELTDFTLEFTVPEDGNYRVGFENVDNADNLVKINYAWLGNHERAMDYKEVISDNGKLIFKANDALFDRNLHRNQLKMYWFTKNDLPEMPLPEGYSFSNYKDISDRKKWAACIWEDHDGNIDEERWQSEIINFTDITPEEDMWFLDYNGEHIGTATSFVYKSSGIGDMHWVGIRKDFRGRGLSKYLSYIVQKSLKDRGVPYVSLTTGEGRPAAVKSYLTAGFIPVEYAEGMVKRWEAVLENYNIESVEMVDENANPLPPVFRASKAGK